MKPDHYQTKMNWKNLSASKTIRMMFAALLILISTSTINAQTVTINETNPIDCFGDADGELTATPAGFIPGGTYSYLWSDGQTTSVASGLPALPSGTTYTVTVTKGAESATNSYILYSPEVLQASNSVNQICFGETTAEISVTLTGGTSPFTYVWSDNNSLNVASRAGLAPGTYTITVTDDNGCSSTTTATATANPQILIPGSVTNECTGYANGSVDITPTGGTGGFSYEWFKSPDLITVLAITQDHAGLNPGTYVVFIEDGVGCTASASFVVGSIPNPTGTITAVTLVACGALSSITFTASAGTGPFDLTINGISYSPVSSGAPFPGPPINGNTALNLTAVYDATVCYTNGAPNISTFTVYVTSSVQNTNTGLYYCSIQAAINDPLTLPGHVIVVGAGTYNENVLLSKAVHLRGANYGISGCSGRGAESYINGGIGIGVDITSDDASIDGFQVAGSTGIRARNHIGVSVKNNLINALAVGIDAGSVVTTALKNLELSGNCVNLASQAVTPTTPTVGIYLSAVSGVQAPVVSNNYLTGAFFGYMIYSVNATPATEIDGGTISGAMQGVAILNIDPVSLAAFAPSNTDVKNITMSGFTGNHPLLPNNNFHAGVYTYTGGPLTTATLTSTLFNLNISGTDKIAGDCGGIILADFSTGAGNRQSITVNECTLTNNLNRGISVRGGNALVDINQCTLTGNGSDPFGGGGNEGFGIIAREGSVVTVDNCFITNPASVTAPYNVFALATDAGLSPGVTLTATSNSIVPNGNVTSKLASNFSGTLNATCNWWGSGVAATVTSYISGTVTYVSFLTNGADNSGVAGFQPVPNSCNGCLTGVTNTTTNITYCTIQSAIDAPSTLNTHTLTVDAGTYNEQVLVNKSLTITKSGATQPTVDFTGTPTGKLTLFDISADGVTIDDIHFNVDLSKLKSAIIASSTGLNNITVTDNIIDAYGTPLSGLYGDRNAVSINYGGPTNYRMATGGVNSVTFTGNTVNAGTYPTMFRAGIAADEVGGIFNGNTLFTINHDMIIRFGSNGNITVNGNNINGGGIEMTEQNSGAGTISVTNNILNATWANNLAPYNPILRLKNNYTFRPTIVSGNTFTNLQWGISLENYNTVTIDNNAFTPLAGSTTYTHITLNTKEFSSSSGFYDPNVDLTLTNNEFYGSGTLGGKALAFYNNDNNTLVTPGPAPVFGTFTIGTAGNENEFASTIGTFMYFDNNTGLVTPNNTQSACWPTDMNAQNNKFDVGSGLQLPSAMSFAGRTTLETKLTHNPDLACLGYITYYYPVHNLTQNTFFMTIQSAIDAAGANDVIECAEWTYNERVTVDKSLTIQGVNKVNTIVTGSGLAGVGSGFFINNGITGVTITGFTIQNFAGNAPNNYAGVYAVGGNDNLTVTNNIIKDNVGGCGIYANGPISNVLIDGNTVSGHTNVSGAARGIVIWNGLKSNINITNNEVFGNNCCGIELQEGSGTDVNVSGNNVHDNGDNGIGLIGLTGPGSNLVQANTLSNNGRFGIEIKNPNGSGASSGAGSVVINNNTVSRTVAIVDARDIAGIAVFRRSVLSGNVDVPYGAYVSNNNVSGYTQSSTSDGFGIIVEGINHTVSTNTVNGCDVGIQRQAGHTPYPGDGDQSDLADSYFGRGNAPYTCAVTLTGNILSNILANGIDTRDVGTVNGVNIVTNNTTGEPFCTIQQAIDDAQTTNGNSITASAGTYNENVVINKELTITGAGKGSNPASNTVLTPSSACSGVGLTISSSNVTVQGMYVTNYQDAILLNGVLNPTINNMALIDYCRYGVSLGGNNSSVDITQTDIQRLSYLASTVGIRAGTANAVNGLFIDNCTINGNTQGMFIAQATIPVAFDNITIQNSTISNNVQKGLYFEKLSNALLDNLTMDNNGTDATYGFNNGIDINLKYASYSNIVIQNSSITNSGSMGTAGDVNNPSAIAVKARDDAPSYNSIPATLTGFTLKNSYVSGPINGLRFGEFNKVNASPTGITVTENHFGNLYSNKAVLNTTSNTNISISCNWYGTTSAPAVSALHLNILSYVPYLTSGTDMSVSPGFQQTAGCSACALVLSTSSTLATCPSLNNGTATVSVTSGGTGPYTYSWTSGAVTSTAGSLVAGIYTATVTDVNGCTQTASVTVTNSLAGPVHNTNTLLNYCTIQAAIDDPLTLNGHTITVDAGTYNEDVTVNKQLSILGAGFATTTVSGPIGGSGSAFYVTVTGVIIDGFTITRDGNNTTDWNNSGLNTAGVAVQGQTATVEVRYCKLFGNRTGIDINNSNGNNIHHNIINDNRTGMILRNQTDNNIVANNFITNNWTVGVLFLDGSGGTNSPVQTAANCSFINNDISGNWYGQIVDRQIGGSLLTPGTNLKNFTCNWYGAIPPTVSTANSAEPGYSSQIPVAYGGTAVPPVITPPMILGPASANFVYIPYLTVSTDVGGNPNDGFQPVAGCSAPCALQILVNPTNASCAFNNDGAATVQITSGGFGPYTYLWSNSQTNATATSLAVGVYSVTVYDLNGCTQTASVTITNGDATLPVITTCAVTRNISGCNTAAVTGPAYNTAVTASSYAEFNSSPNNGVATDNCAITTVTYQDVSSGTCPTVVTRTWRISDANGNTATCTQTINIIHTVMPAEVGGPVTSSSSVDCATSATAPVSLPVVQDQCGTVLSPSGPTQQLSFTNNFSSAVTLSTSAAPGVWYTDRYAPAGFTAPVLFGGDNRLMQSINAADGPSSRPGAFSAAFYNTQGRAYDLGTATNAIEIKLYIPSAWATTNKRMAGLWGVPVDGSNAVSGYPIVEYTSDGNNPRFHVWEDALGWVDIGLPGGFAYDTWTTLKIRLLPTGQFLYSAGSLNYISTTYTSPLSVRIKSVILQGHNYDPNNVNNGVTYDIYWDDLKWNDIYAAPACEGTITYTYLYTDCAGLPYPWVYTYTVDHVTFPAEVGGPVASASAVECATSATAPVTLPVVNDVCGNPIAAPAPSQQLSFTNNFTAAVTLSSSAAAGVWYTDRYAPAGFTSPVLLGGDNRLKQSIDAADGLSLRALPYQSAFYNTQGRSYDLGTTTNAIEIKLYIPLAWATTNKRMAGLWGVAVDNLNAVSGYPIVEFTSDGGVPRFRVWESGTGVWVDLGLPGGFTYDTWTTLKIRLLPTGEFLLSAGSLNYLTNTSAPDASVRLKSVILQGHNYDPNNVNNGVTYDIYWDDLKWNDAYAALCEGAITYTYLYTDCAGLPYPWVYTYTVDHVTFPAEVGGPVTSASSVECPASATAPVTLPVVNDVCGNPIAAPVPAQQLSFTNNFTAAVTLSSSAAPGVWYTDRYAPAGFTSPVIFGGDDRLKQSIDAADGPSSRPGAFSGAFYNTQGRAYDLGTATNAIEIKLYIPSAWATTNKRMAGLWGVAVDNLNAVSGYPIVEFTSDGNNPRFRAYDNGIWFDMGLPGGFVYDSWVTLKIRLLPTGQFLFTAGSLNYASTNFTPLSSVRIKSNILQGHNYDPSNVNNGVTYDIYWDDLKWNDAYAAPACLGTITYTYLYTDCAGLPYPWVFTYTIDHVTAPAVPVNGSTNVQCLANATTPTPPSVTDVCGTAVTPVLVSTVDAPLVITCSGTRTYNYTYTDCSGLVSNWSFVYNVADNTPPTISCPAATTVIANNAGCTYNGSIGTATGTDNCSTPVITRSPSGDLPVGVNVVTWISTDACGNSTTCTQSVTVTNPATASITETDNSGLANDDNIICNGGNATLSASAATSYAWTPNDGSLNSTNSQVVVASPTATTTYTLTTTSAIGCTASTTISITVNPVPVVSNAATKSICSGANTNITLTSVVPSTYSWTIGATTGSAITGASGGSGSSISQVLTISSNTTPGTVEYIVTPTSTAGGCTGASFTITVTVNPLPVISSSVVGKVKCKGDNSGSVDITPGLGTPGYTYLWNNGSVTQDVSSLFAGNYTVTVSDANGCKVNGTYAVTQPTTVLVISLSKTNVRCGGKSTGKIDAIPSGGVTGYTYLWNTGSTAAGITNLAVGTYTVTVTDANGCIKVKSTSITSPVTLTAFVVPGPSANQATANPSGGTFPYTYSWNTSPVQTGQTAIGLTSGSSYKVKVTDSKGCTAVAIGNAMKDGNGSANNIEWNVNVYPNPTDGIVNLFITNNFEKAGVVKLFDGLGQLVYSGELTEKQKTATYDFSTLPKGVYSLSIEAGDKRKVIHLLLQ